MIVGREGGDLDRRKVYIDKLRKSKVCNFKCNVNKSNKIPSNYNVLIFWNIIISNIWHNLSFEQHLYEPLGLLASNRSR